MKMTTRGRYGLRAVLELARCYGGPPVLMSTLADREHISRKYLHTLLVSLKSAGIVHSVRGAGGGFLLSKDPAQVRLNEILHAVEGPLSLVECVSRPAMCKRANACTARRVWQELSDAIEEVLGKVTLARLIAMETGPSKKSGRSTTADGAPRRGTSSGSRACSSRRPAKGKK
jgi:Rrf2 family transcriptional regulator, cysteine metabolism repressor